MTDTNIPLTGLVVDKKMQEYRDGKNILRFWDIFSDLIPEGRINQALASSPEKYYGNTIGARNDLIKEDLEKNNLFLSARDVYGKITSEKTIEIFRTTIFSWSTSGKNYIEEENIKPLYKKSVSYLTELFSEGKSDEIESISETIDSMIDKIQEEYGRFDAVRAAYNFYRKRPIPGKQTPVYNGVLDEVSHLARHIRKAGSDETYFQKAVAYVRQYRDMLDPVKDMTEDYRAFISSGDKLTSDIKHDTENTLTEYITTLVSLGQMQKKTKEEIRDNVNSFIQETEYTLTKLSLEISPIYNSTLDKMMFKKAGWKVEKIPVKK